MLVTHTFDGLPPSFRHGSVGAAVASCDSHLSRLGLLEGGGRLLANPLPCSIVRILDIFLVVSSRALQLVLRLQGVVPFLCSNTSSRRHMGDDFPVSSRAFVSAFHCAGVV